MKNFKVIGKKFFGVKLYVKEKDANVLRACMIEAMNIYPQEQSQTDAPYHTEFVVNVAGLGRKKYTEEEVLARSSSQECSEVLFYQTPHIDKNLYNSFLFTDYLYETYRDAFDRDMHCVRRGVIGHVSLYISLIRYIWDGVEVQKKYVKIEYISITQNGIEIKREPILGSYISEEECKKNNQISVIEFEDENVHQC